MREPPEATPEPTPETPLPGVAPNPGPSSMAGLRRYGDAVRLVQEQLDREERRIEERRRELVAAKEALAGLDMGGMLRAAGSSIEPVSAELAPALVSRLLRESSGVMRNLVLMTDSGPALDDATMRDNREFMARGNEQRSLYPASMVGTTHGDQWLRAWGEIGEVQRIAPVNATEFAVFGSRAVVGLARWGDPTSGYVVVREPLLVAVFSAYFDACWVQAVPVSTGPASAAGDEDLIELLGLGLKDEAIARYLGLGLRTVRRRIARLMAVHGVETRYQLGVAVSAAAQRRPRGIRPR
jgi:hypothetical protein